MFYSLLPQRHRWVEAQGQAAEFIIDETFGVPGVGTVVAGASRGSAARQAMPALAIAERCVIAEACNCKQQLHALIPAASMC
jgi:hypothetical protein